MSRESGLHVKQRGGTMNVTAWNNGQHHPSGAAYGLKINRDGGGLLGRHED